ncbi:ABC transporter ATP-binding protein [uncultured Mucilaginibacter sp.]|uniref:ABC transporter ATP-binding protein n=1 Tax=uncultured Mucilaginibacter sp. TaxID=797541 RepID=UPI00261F2456|nr:ABC transporter ATP-binding protein [uncultured Mucilaginibacter sp.]
MSLKVDRLNVSFKTGDTNFYAVKEVSFQLEPGKVLGIVGESGSGKSVTSLALMRLLDEEKAKVTGSILLNNKALLELSEAEMRSFRGNQIGMIFQEPMTSLNPVLTCGYQVAEAIQLHLKLGRKEAKSKTIELFEEVQLPRPEAIFGLYPHQISGGQKQRVMIAMALSCSPEILIADEPTTALDVTVQKSILELLLRIKNERNSSLIFISHDLGVIREIADEVIVMYKGRIVEQAAAETIFSDPQHPYTKGLLACRPSPQFRLKKLPVIRDFLKTGLHGEIQTFGTTIHEIRQRYALSDDEKKQRQKKLYDQEPLLKIKNLNTWFPIKKGFLQRSTEVVKAVNNISFEVFPGETLGLVGESGCGKTTLGRSLIRLIEPNLGKIIFKGQDILTLPQNEMCRMRKKMQLIFQDPYSSLNPKLSIGNAILEPMEVHGLYANQQQRKKKVLELLDRVNLLPEHFNRYPHEFSGGQRQRIVIARALALQPEFIICDESVSALDVSVQAQVLNLLKELQREFNLTYIFISHDLSVVKHFADRMMVMNKGEIIETGDPQEIYEHPKETYTQKLIASIPGSGLPY